MYKKIRIIYKLGGVSVGMVQNIENRLMEINETVFQELCDSFLILRNENYAAFSRSGSQAGKQKTRKGTPDSFLLLSNGKYIFVEFSTNVTQGVKKLKEDILKCLDVQKTGISYDLIAEIIICVNFKLNPQEIAELNKEIIGTTIKLVIFTLDSLALEIALRYKGLASVYLGLNLDSGQIVNVDRFIKEYNKAFNWIATPLDNGFFFRENEKEQIFNALNEADLIVVSGPPGVGKTKLVLESMNSFIIENPSYNAYCVSNKQYPILEDLNSYFVESSDYILFIDDANRIDTLSQILAFHNKFNEGNFKIILTVRDYAINEIEKKIYGKKREMIFLEKLFDEALIKIIEEEPFGILNEKYQKEILNVADGNPRIAIMTALLAMEKQNISIFQDLGEVFEKYFSIFATDYLDITKETTAKCLGIIAAFNILPYRDREILETILEKFGIEYGDFINEIDWLESIELVEIRYDHVKITEQNISNYFFYLAFIKNEYLSFETLLNCFYSSKSERIKDSILGANNSFGYEKVINKVKSILTTYFESIDQNDKKIDFLKTFWFYLQEEFMEYIFTYINEMPEQNVSEYHTDYEQNQFSFNRNPIIELLGNYFEFTQNNLKDILLLSIEYVRKMPIELPELIYQLKKSFALNIDDDRTGYHRQFLLLDILEEGIKKEDFLYKTIYFKTASFLLEVKFERVRPGRKNTVTFETLTVKADSKIIELRKKVLDILFQESRHGGSSIINVLKEYVTQYSIDSNLANIEKDSIERIFEAIFSSSNLEHCLLIQDYIDLLDILEIEKDEFVQKFSAYKTEEFNRVQILDWEKLNGKNRHYHKDYDTYDKRKEIEIREALNFNDVSKMEEFFKDYIKLSNYIYNNWNKNKVLDIIVDENFIKNDELNIPLLDTVINSVELDFIPYLIFKRIVTSKEWIEEIYFFVLKLNNPIKIRLLLVLLENLRLEDIEEKYVIILLKTLEESTDTVNICLDYLNYIFEYDQEFLNNLIRISAKQNSSVILQMLDFRRLIKYFDKIKEVELYKAFLVKNRVQYRDFYRYKDFLFYIFKRENSLLIDFLERNSEYYNSHERVSLNVIWELNDPYQLMVQVFNIVLKKGFYISDHFANILFKDLKEQHLEIAKHWLLEYVAENNKDIDKMNLVLDIVHNSRNNWLKDVLIKYLTLNKDINQFKKIHWVTLSRTLNGDELFAEVQAVDWNYIQNVVKEINGGIELIPIKKFISDILSRLSKSAEAERKRNYLEERLI